MIRRAITTVVTLLSLSAICARETAARTLNIDSGCGMTKTVNRVGQLPVERPSSEALAKFREILVAQGMDETRIEFLSAALPSKGLATFVRDPSDPTNIKKIKRYVLYDVSLMTDIESGGASKWVAYALLAHEIGHFANGDDISGSTPEAELSADRFAGSVLARLNASNKDVEIAFSKTDLESVTHNSRDQRIAAALTGWKNAKGAGRAEEITIIDSWLGWRGGTSTAWDISSCNGQEKCNVACTGHIEPRNPQGKDSGFPYCAVTYRCRNGETRSKRIELTQFDLLDCRN